MKGSGIYRADDDKLQLVSRKLKHTDIMSAILQEDKRLDDDTIVLGQFDRSRSGLRDLYNAVRDNLQYKIDPKDKQIIKSPEYAIQHRNCDVSTRDKFCGSDCKSFSLLTASQLRKMRIPYYYSKIQQTGLPDNMYHLYPIAILDGQEIPMDATPAGRFGVEPKYRTRQLYRHSRYADAIGISDRSTSGSSVGETLLGLAIVGGIIYGVNKWLS